MSARTPPPPQQRGNGQGHNKRHQPEGHHRMHQPDKAPVRTPSYWRMLRGITVPTPDPWPGFKKQTRGRGKLRSRGEKQSPNQSLSLPKGGLATFKKNLVGGCTGGGVRTRVRRSGTVSSHNPTSFDHTGDLMNTAAICHGSACSLSTQTSREKEALPHGPKRWLERRVGLEKRPFPGEPGACP